MLDVGCWIMLTHAGTRLPAFLDSRPSPAPLTRFRSPLVTYSLHSLHSIHSRGRGRVSIGRTKRKANTLCFPPIPPLTLRGCSAMRSSMHYLNSNRRLFLSLPNQSSSSTRWFASKSKSKVSILIPDTRYLIPDHLYLYLIRRVHPTPPSHIPRIIFQPTTRPKSSHIQIT